MPALTPSERRGAAVVVLLLAIGSVHDLWRAHHPALTRAPRWEETSGPPAGGRGAPAPMPGTEVADRGGSLASPRPAASVPLDLNRAGLPELDALPGIGPVLAGRIVEHRARYGPFRSVDELLAVRGIGTRLLERLRPRVVIRAPARETRGPAANPKLSESSGAVREDIVRP